MIIQRAVFISLVLLLAVFLASYFWLKDQTASRDAKASCPPDCNVVIILLDSLRADHMGCYGYERNTTPNLDQFAAENILFENAYSQSSWTKPSIASLFTSLYVSQHGVILGRFEPIENISTSDILDPSFLTIAEAFKQNDYYTESITTNPHLNVLFGFDQGFDSYQFQSGWAVDINRRMYSILEGRHSLNSSERALGQSAAGKKNFFVYAHYLDTHFPYRHPWYDGGQCVISHGNVSLDVLNAPAIDYNKFDEYLSRLKKSEKTGIANGCMVDAYDGGIRYTDNILGSLIKKIKKTGLYDKTVIIIISDHGEEFLERGGILHGRTVFNEVIHVPLIIHLPGLNQSKRVSENVGLIDIMPTLMDYLNLSVELPYRLEGESLIPLATGVEKDDDRYIISEVGPWLRAAVYERWKLIKGGKVSSLYDLESDPLEKEGVSGGEGALVRDLEGKLREVEMRQITPGFKPKQAVVDNETLNQLRSF